MSPSRARAAIAFLLGLAAALGCNDGDGGAAPRGDSGAFDAAPTDGGAPVDDATPADGAAPDGGCPAAAATVEDTDGDGVGDAAERCDGTDPLDPASARAWQPDRLVERPRLLFGPADVERVRERLASPAPAHAALLDRIRAQAQRPPPPHPADGTYDPSVPPERAAVAETRAFLALMETDTANAEGVIDLLLADFPDPSGLDLVSGYDLLEAEALVSYCLAYDLLAAHPSLAAERLQLATEALDRRIDAFRQTCLEGALRPMVTLSRNNHAMKVQAALGICALALNDRPTAAADLNEALTGLHHLLVEVQGTVEGGYAEGWNYLTYAGNSHLPFLLAYHRFARGEAHTYRATGRTVFPFPDAGRLLEIPDPATDPRVRAIYEAALWATRPDGQTPPTDDANPSPMHGPLVAALFEDPRYLTPWYAAGERGGPPYFAARNEVATFALLDPAVEPAPVGAAADGCLPDAGFAILRDDFTEDARFLLVQGEHGAARLHGFGHEQPDATSFLLDAFGEQLLLDPGYVNWENRDLVAHAADHNLVLVDGEGPPLGNVLDVGVDAWLEGWDPDPDLTTVTVRAAYGGARFVRRVVRVRGDYFVVADQIDGDALRTYTALLHGNGGGDLGAGTFEAFEGGARWVRPGARVEAWVAATHGATSHETFDAEHQEGWGQVGLHTALAVSAEQGPRAGFLTVVVPRRTAHPSPEVVMERTADAVVARVADDVVSWRRAPGDPRAGLTIEAAGLPPRAWPLRPLD